MNICLLEHFVRSLGILFVSVVSLFSNDTYDEYVINVENQNKELGLSMVNAVPNYSSIPIVMEKSAVETKMVVETKPVVVSTPTITEKKEIVTQPIEPITIASYTGRVTGYGPDCQGCKGTGNLACKTRENTTHSLVSNGIYYNDVTFGNIRILAAKDSAKFPCGTVIKITKADGVSYMAIVLDRMASSLSNGQELLDLAYSSQTDKSVFAVDGLTGYNMKFEVKRLGW